MRYSAERSSYETQISQLNIKISELSSQIVFLNEDNTRLNQNAIERLREIEKFKALLEKSCDEEQLAELRRRVADLKVENDSLHERCLKTSNEKNLLNAKLKSADNDLELVRSENSDLKQYLA